MSRPEHFAPPEVFYDEFEAKKYAKNSRMKEIQSRMTERAIELLALPAEQSSYILDIGCGSGLSGEVLTELGHHWVGIDISPSMLEVASEEELEGDLMLQDMGQGLMFRAGCFDGAISISALQWLCNADKGSHHPRRRLTSFFQTLYNSLSRGSRAVFQFYPENSEQLEMITSAAMRCGFAGGLVVDYPNSTKAKKYFLVLMAGASENFVIPAALGTGDADSGMIHMTDKADRRGTKKVKKVLKKSKDWIQAKKERQRRQGKDVRPDSKYSGRQRKPRF
eukprot:GCRY01002891.1.p1 GENE.GCRY01002891.1~~GCRY01002891.1.p1  ORF type:complete len:279 (-),score=54.00 GCRY01002891.1:17-853(-)